MKLSRDRLRIIIMGAVVWLVFSVFVLRLADLQIVKGSEYLAQQKQGSSRSQVIKAARGEIVDRHGKPFTYNEVCYNLVFDKALEPKNSTNETILKLIKIMKASGESWNDSLPLKVDGSVAFDGPEEEIARLKSKKYLNLNSYSTAQEVVYWINTRYELKDYDPNDDKVINGYSDADARAIAGVRYEMEKKGYSLSTRYTFAEDVSLETAVLIRQQNYLLPGVDVVETAKRSYTGGDLAPHIIGRTGIIFAEELEYYLSLGRGYTTTDSVGKEGVERAFEGQLRGVDGVRLVNLDSDYNVVDVVVQQQPIPGNTLVLTLDQTMQRTAIDAMEKEILWLNENAKEGEGKEANAGAVVAIDIKSGEVLVASTFPSYDLGTYQQDFAKNNSDPLFPFLNRALNGIYAPGSCFKPVTSIAGLTREIITPETRINCARVYNFYPSYQPTCLGFHGLFTVTDALRESCNVFFYDTGRQLGIEVLNEYARQLGLGVPTGIELSESRGNQSDAMSLNPGDALQTAIGQLDNGYTPIQLANYTATLARNGVKKPLTIVKSVSSYYDWKQPVITAEKRESTKVDAPDSAFETVRDGMVQATHNPQNGTAYHYLGDYPIRVASKTGTPQTSDFPNSTFICYAPADNPQIAIAVVIEKGWHGYTGAPVARAVLDSYFFPEKVAEAKRLAEEEAAKIAEETADQAPINEINTPQ